MNESLALSIEPKKYDLLLVSETNNFDQRMEYVANSFSYSYFKVATATEAEEKLVDSLVQFSVIDAGTSKDQNDVVGAIQVLRFLFPKTNILVVFPKKIDKSTLDWIRKSGANFLMSEGDFLTLAKFDFMANQMIGTDYLPVKHADFKVGSKIEIPLYYSMPANRKYVPIIKENTILDDSRIEKIRKIGEVYIRRIDVERYHQYLQANQDQSAKGLIRRCRVQFGEFRTAYLKLVNHLTEDSEAATYEEGKKILEECQKLSEALITSMMSAGSVFDIISQSVAGEFNSVERAPERAAIIGYFCVMGDIGNSQQAILATLLADVGMLNLPYETLNYFRLNGINSLDETKRLAYDGHPQGAINCAAQKKIQLDPLVRDTILYSHARLDQTGYPVVRREKIGIEAQLLQLVQILDDLCQIQWGKTRPIYSEVLKSLILDPATMGFLSPVIIKALRSI